MTRLSTLKAKGFRRPLPAAATLAAACEARARHESRTRGREAAAPTSNSRGHVTELLLSVSNEERTWLHAWDAWECEAPLRWCKWLGGGERGVGGGEQGVGAMEGLLELVISRGCRRLGERLVEEGSEAVVALEEERVARLVACALAAGCAGLVSVWADAGLPYALEKVLDGACTQWRSLMRRQRSSAVVGIRDGELVLNGGRGEAGEVPLSTRFPVEMRRCVDALLPALQQVGMEDETEEAAAMTSSVRHAEEFSVDITTPVTRSYYLHSSSSPHDVFSCQRLDALPSAGAWCGGLWSGCLARRPSVVSWCTSSQRQRRAAHALLEDEKEKRRDAVGRIMLEDGLARMRGIGEHTQAEAAALYLRLARLPRREHATEYTTEYRGRYTFPSVVHTREARRSRQNKDAGWRQGIDTADFKKPPPPPRATARDSSESDGSSCFVAEAFVYPGPGAYEADEGLRRMLERVRVAPSFGVGRRFLPRSSIRVSSASCMDWIELEERVGEDSVPGNAKEDVKAVGV